MLEPGLDSLARTIDDLADQQRALWRDQPGRDFEANFLRPLGEAIAEFRALADQFREEVEAALAELREY